MRLTSRYVAARWNSVLPTPGSAPEDVLETARDVAGDRVFQPEHKLGGYQLMTYAMPVDELLEELKTELVIEDDLFVYFVMY